MKWILSAYFLPQPPLAITGTNGKTTVSSLISHVYNKLGEKSVLAGNMGYSFIRAFVWFDRVK